MDILLHPTFRVPCPYLTLWDENGKMLPWSQVQEAMVTDYVGDSGNDGSPTVNATKDPEFMFVQEEHPFLGSPGLCLHVCGLSERMELLGVTSSTSADRDKGYKDKDDQMRVKEEAAGMYLLRWFAVVGPTIGMPISPTFYRQAECLFRGGH